MRAAVLILVPLLYMIIAVPVITGIYVYRDAVKRGMNAAAWTLAVVFAPMLIGFIIYLLVRGSYPNLRCPKRAHPVPEIQDDILIPIKPEDKALGKVFLVLIAIPVVLIIFAAVSFSLFSSSSDLASCITILADEYIRASANP